MSDKHDFKTAFMRTVAAMQAKSATVDKPPVARPLTRAKPLLTGHEFAHLVPVPQTSFAPEPTSLAAPEIETTAQRQARQILLSASMRDRRTGVGEADLPKDPVAAAIIIAGRRRDQLGRS